MVCKILWKKDILGLEYSINFKIYCLVRIWYRVCWGWKDMFMEGVIVGDEIRGFCICFVVTEDF